MTTDARRPRIGISCRLVKTAPNETELMGVKTTYIDSILEAGGTPVLVPLLDDESLLRSIYENVDGLLIPGGEDVDPKWYGEERHPKLGNVSALRDEVEIKLVRWAHADNKPVLGVCRGLQVINVALGGSLYQDIPSQASGADEHFNAVRDAAAHEVEVKPDSKLCSLLGAARLKVNSFHHQAVKELAAPLAVNAQAADGIVEGFEEPSRRFFLALQCHPELLWQKSTDRSWLELFRAFVAAAVK